jgi:hippurate hydrolase
MGGKNPAVVSRNADPTQPLVLSVTQVHAGSAYNVIPATAEIAGTIRFFDHALIQMTRQRVRELAAGMAASFGVEIDVEIREIFEVLENDPDLAHAMIDIAGEVVGTENSTESTTARTGSEDFADMLRAVPGAYCTLGHAGTMPLHSPQFVLDESILPVGAAIYARLVERRTGA